MKKQTLSTRLGRHATCKLTNAQAFFIRGTRKRVSALLLARDFGVSPPVIFHIRQGTLYCDIPMNHHSCWRELRKLQQRYGVEVNLDDARRLQGGRIFDRLPPL